MLVLVSSGIAYSTFYAISATISVLFAQHYPFLSEIEIGLCFLSIMGGGAIGTVLQGRVLDWQFRKVKKEWERQKSERNVEKSDAEEAEDNHHDEDFPIEKATLQTQCIWILLFSVATVGYGWALQRGVSIAVPLVLHFIRESCS